MTTLLAVDDSVTMRKVLEITFAGEDYRLLSASSGDAALEIVRRDKPDIVILDISLPGQDGYAVCAAMKAAHPRGFVVLLSSKQVAYDAARGTAAGADEFTDKPFDTQQFIEKVRKVLAGQPNASTAAAPSATATAAPPAVTAAPPAVAAAPAAPAPATAGPSQPATPRPIAPPLAGPAPSPLAQSTLLFAGAPIGQAAGTQPTKPPAPASSRTEPSMEHAIAARTTAPAANTVAPAVAGTAAGSAAAAQIASASASLGPKLSGLGLDQAQVEAVLALSREVVERIVWEVVPTLAETIIKEELRRLTAE